MHRALMSWDRSRVPPHLGLEVVLVVLPRQLVLRRDGHAVGRHELDLERALEAVVIVQDGCACVMSM